MLETQNSPPPQDILEQLQQRAAANLFTPAIADVTLQEQVDYVCRCLSNRAGVRLLMACLLAKLAEPHVDPRKPYTEIGDSDSFSGRTYDERYITPFINHHRLPVNPTTAFLTPTLRNRNQALTRDQTLVGRPRALYQTTLELLDDVAAERVTAQDLLTEILRILMLLRDEKLARISALLQSLDRSQDAPPLSSEAIITLISQHLACKNASRLPVLVVAAAYDIAGPALKEQRLALQAHNAADLQTGSLGDLEITTRQPSTVEGIEADSLENAVTEADRAEIVTVYEMKLKRVTQDDIEGAIAKIARAKAPIQNYLFVTTEAIDPAVTAYANSFYQRSQGIEIAILDCISFLRHFLHLFHRQRTHYLNAYQALVLQEPDSAVSQTLKEAFLALRQTAESDE